MSGKKKALVITDGTSSILSIAHSISDLLDGYNVNICQAENFVGNDLLGADVFFIGCEKAQCASFNYLEELLSHINLASRKCGIFSVKDKTSHYLHGILKDCEAAVGSPFLAPKGEFKKSDLKKWLKSIL